MKDYSWSIIAIGVIFLLVALMGAADVRAQIVPSQNQQIIAPYGGFIVATSSSGNSKLSATSTPFFSSFFATLGNIGTLTLPNQTSALLQTDGSGVVSEYGGSTCPGGEFVNALSALGIVTCATPAGGSGGLATTTPWVVGELAQVFSDGAVNSIATSSLGLPTFADLPSFGTDNQIPFTNAGGTDFDYSSQLTFDGAKQLLVGAGTGQVGALNITRGDSVNQYIVLQENAASPGSVYLTFAGSNPGAMAMGALYTAGVPTSYVFTDQGGTPLLSIDEATGNLTTTIADGCVEAASGVLGSTGSPCASGSGNVATSSAETATYVPFWTSTAGTPALLSGGESTFTYDSSLNKLTVENASTSALSISGLTSALVQVGADGTTAEYAGTTCTNQFVRALSALGLATCESVNLVSDVTGTLGITNGGTGTSTPAVLGQVLYWNGTNYQAIATSSLNISATPAGSDTQVQFNNAGAFGADPLFTFSIADSALSVPTFVGQTFTASLTQTASSTETASPSSLELMLGAFDVGDVTARGGAGDFNGGGVTLDDAVFYTGGASGGNFDVTAGSLDVGAGVSLDGAQLSIGGGSFDGVSTYTAGSANLLAGNSVGITGNGGSVLVASGVGNTNGYVNFVSNADSGSGFYSRLDTSALSATRTLTVPNLSGVPALGSFTTGFTGGSVPFGSSGLLATSTLVFDSARTALGIGTTTPRWSLTAASSTGPQLTLTNGSLTNAPFNFRATASNLYVSTSSPSTFATSSSPILTLDSSTASTTVVKLDKTGTATSTFAGGVNLTGGCFAISGTCVGGSSATIAVYETTPVGKPTATFANLTTNVNTTMFLGLVNLPAAITVNQISMDVQTVSTGGTLDLTVYSATGASQPIAVTTATISGTGISTTAVSAVTLPAGNYYFAINPNGTADIAIRGVTIAGSAIRNPTGKPVTVGTLTITAGTPPATIDPTAITVGTQMPLWRLDN